MTNANPAIHVVHPTTSTHSTAEKNRLMGKPRFHFEPRDVMQRLKQRIIGQEAALDEIEKMLHVVKADFSSPERPLCVTLMLGPTGVGKTETVRLISEVIYGRPDAFCRIDMNTLAQEHYAAAITGAPPGYVGSKEGHSLFDETAIAGSHTCPGIVLFDEGKEVTRLDGMLFSFHFKELFRYVGGGYYKKYSTYNEYLAERQAELLKQGTDIHIVD